MTKINKILFGLVVLLILVLAGVIYWQAENKSDDYWAVYLNTGDLYFGKLNRFPQLSLTDVWFVQKNSQDNQNPYTLTQLSKAFWGPQDQLFLNEKDIVWKTELKADSQVLQYIKNPQAYEGQAGQQTGQPGNVQLEATSTPR